MQKYHFPLSASQALIFLNGQRNDVSHIRSKTDEYKSVIVADGAWNDLHGLLPLDNVGVDLVVIGDGDSIEIKPPCFIQAINQDVTDFEKVIMHCLDENIASADVFWASGSEMDHFLGNLSVAAKYHNDITLRFFDETHVYFFTSHNIFISGALGKKVSIYPFPECVVTSSGLAYEMDKLLLNQHQQQSLRNHINTDQVEITIQGSAFVFIER